jgi:hypothetical protein
MREIHRGRLGVVLAAVTMLTAGAIPATATAAPKISMPAIPACPRVPGVPPDRLGMSRPAVGPRDGVSGSSWETTLDPTGSVVGHTLRLGAGGIWRAGSRAFADGPYGDTLVTGERSPAGTRVRLIDLTRACTKRILTLRALVYGSVLLADGTLVVSLVHPVTRAELGVWQVASDPTARPRRIILPPTGAPATAVPRESTLWATPWGVRARWCAGGACVERSHDRPIGGLAALVDLDPDAELDAAASLPLRSPRPVPVYDRWFPWSVLSFRFHGTDTSPSWMREAVEDAADDATDTSRSLSPIFVPAGSGSLGVIRYSSSFPATCSNAIACAGHDADQWTLRMRPQGYDFRWGELHWCQKTLMDGCFDAERVALHEFGHVVGLDHPEVAGFRLSPSYTVMHQVTASRPHASWERHSFGPCDVASLQEQFGTPTMSTLISTCNDVDARLNLSASAGAVGAGERIVLSAVLKVRSDADYGELSGMRLNGRSVQLRRRAAGSTGAWTTSWMRWAEVPGLYTITLYPRASYDYQAVFAAPDDEGLHGDSSDVVTVRVTGGCAGGCTNEEDPT